MKFMIWNKNNPPKWRAGSVETQSKSIIVFFIASFCSPVLRQQSNYPLLKNMKLEKLRLYIPMNCVSEWNQVRFQRSN